MRFQGAIVREQGVKFAIVVVKKHLIENRIEADRATASFRSVFLGMPVVLMAQDNSGRPTYYGRPDISRFLANKTLPAIPWQEYTLH